MDEKKLFTITLSLSSKEWENICLGVSMALGA